MHIYFVKQYPLQRWKSGWVFRIGLGGVRAGFRAELSKEKSGSIEGTRANNFFFIRTYFSKLDFSAPNGRIDSEDNRTTEFCLQLIDLFVCFCFISF